MIDPKQAGVSEEVWTGATASCVSVRVARVVQETADSRSIVLEVPAELAERFRYRAGQFLSFKVPFEGMVLVRSYSLSSSPECDEEHKVTIKRVDRGRISNWMNDEVAAGDTLMVVPPAGFFTLNDEIRKLVFFSGGSGITPVIALIKTALVTTERRIKLVYANRDKASIIFHDELEELRRRHADRFEIEHSLDDVQGFLVQESVKRYADEELDADFFLCGPGAFMATVESALEELGVHLDRIHLEHFASPPDPDSETGEAPASSERTETGASPTSVTIVLDGESHEIPYEPGERILHAARRAGLDPPFSCEEGYCSCCMAKLASGEVKMDTNDCLTSELLDEGWVLTCQGRCMGGIVRVEYPE